MNHINDLIRNFLLAFIAGAMLATSSKLTEIIKLLEVMK